MVTTRRIRNLILFAMFVDFVRGEMEDQLIP